MCVNLFGGLRHLKAALNTRWRFHVASWECLDDVTWNVWQRPGRANVCLRGFVWEAISYSFVPTSWNQGHVVSKTPWRDHCGVILYETMTILLRTSLNKWICDSCQCVPQSLCNNWVWLYVWRSFLCHFECRNDHGFEDILEQSQCWRVWGCYRQLSELMICSSGFGLYCGHYDVIVVFCPGLEIFLTMLSDSNTIWTLLVLCCSVLEVLLGAIILILLLISFHHNNIDTWVHFWLHAEVMHGVVATETFKHRIRYISFSKSYTIQTSLTHCFIAMCEFGFDNCRCWLKPNHDLAVLEAFWDSNIRAVRKPKSWFR